MIPKRCLSGVTAGVHARPSRHGRGSIVTASIHHLDIPRLRSLTTPSLPTQASRSSKTLAVSLLTAALTTAVLATPSLYTLISGFTDTTDDTEDREPHHLDGAEDRFGPIFHRRAFDRLDGFRAWTIKERDEVSPGSFILTLVRREQKDKSGNVDRDGVLDELKKYHGCDQTGPVGVETDDRALARFATNDVLESLYRSAIWTVEVKQPYVQVSRQYTPLPPLPTITDADNDDTDFATATVRLFVRSYAADGGTVSGYLDRLRIGSRLYLRGPSLEAVIPAGPAGPVVFLAAGTGIAPALQLATALSRRSSSADTDDPIMHILWSCRSAAECSASVFATPTSNWVSSIKRSFGWTKPTQSTVNPLTSRLQALQTVFPGLRITVFPSPTRVSISNVVDPLRSTTINRTNLETPVTVLVAGPERYLSYWTGSVATPTVRPSDSALAVLGRATGVGLVRSIRMSPTSEQLAASRLYDQFGRQLPGPTRGVMMIADPTRQSANLEWHIGRMEAGSG